MPTGLRLIFTKNIFVTDRCKRLWEIFCVQIITFLFALCIFFDDEDVSGINCSCLVSNWSKLTRTPYLFMNARAHPPLSRDRFISIEASFHLAHNRCALGCKCTLRNYFTSSQRVASWISSRLKKILRYFLFWRLISPDTEHWISPKVEMCS